MQQDWRELEIYHIIQTEVKADIKKKMEEVKSG